MPNVGLMSYDGEVKRTWQEVREDLESGNIGWAEPCDPALLAFLLEESEGRLDVDPEEVSASQLEKGIRALYLEATVPYFVIPDDQIASIMGTMKHAMVNRERPGFVTETRLFFEEGGIRFGSAKCDTYYVPTRKLVDLKNIKWYKVGKMLNEGALKAAKGYAYQINLFRVLMKQPENQALLLQKYPWLRPEHFDVQTMQLTCTPPDLSGPNKKEAEKLVMRPKVVPILVPHIPDEDVLAAYRSKYYDKQNAFQTGTAPLCTPEERWEKEWGEPTKCVGFCPVVEACRKMSAERNEVHPLDEWAERKAARQAAKEQKELEKALTAAAKPPSRRSKTSPAAN